MKLIKKHLALLLIFTQSLLYGDFSNADKQFLEIKNLLKNPGAEQNLSGWDKFGAAGSSLSITKNPTYVGSGAAAIAYDASASGQYLGSSLATVPSGIYGDNCLGKISYKGGDANLTFQVVNQSGTSLGSSVLVTASNYGEATTTFTCPSSGSMGIRISASANAAAVFLDDAYLGKNYRAQTSITRTENSVVCDTPNGHGSTGTNIRKYTNCTTTGTAITYAANPSNNGDTFTINEEGLYYVGVTDKNTGGAYDFGVSKNASSLTTSITGLATAEIVAYAQGPTNSGAHTSAVVWLTASTIIRVQDDGSTNATTDEHKFRIVKILNKTN